MLQVLRLDAQMQKLAEELKHESSLLVFGRGYNYATALEAALKVRPANFLQWHLNQVQRQSIVSRLQYQGVHRLSECHTLRHSKPPACESYCQRVSATCSMAE